MRHLDLPPLKPVAWLVACFCASTLTAQAQTLDNVVVSASRSEQKSFDAAAAIQSVDRETIQDAGPQVNLSESLNRVPGLTILNRQNYAQDLQVSIRGFGARTAFGIRGIRLLIDGIPATTPDGQGQGSSISLPSTERIEVLRGPLAQLYGNSAGGVIQAFTREAPETPEFMYQYYAGSFGMHRNDWQYAGKNGGVGIVADYSTFDTSGYRDNSATQRKQFNGKLSFGPDEKTRVNVVFNQFDMPLAQDPLGLSASQVAANPQQEGLGSAATGQSRLRAASEFGVRKTILQNQLGTSLFHDLGEDLSISARAYYGTRDNLQFQAGSSTVAESRDGSWVSLNRAYYGVGLQFNAMGKFIEHPVKLAMGMDLDRSREYRQGGAASAGQKKTTTRMEDNQAENSDLFAQATILTSEKWSLTGGARQSTVRFTSDDYYVVAGNGDGSGNVSYSAFNPVLGATYHATDRLNLYANYGRGFETPTLAEAAYTSTSVASAKFNTGINASRSTHYEIGLKWVPSNGARFDATLYQINTVDEIVTLASASGITTYQNAPGTSRSGLELSSYNVLTPNWRANVAASWIDAIYTQSFTTTTSVANGNKMPGIPQHFLYSELVWTDMPVSLPKAKPLGLSVGVEMISSGRLFANDTNKDSADGYTVLNLKASHAWNIGKGRLTTYARVDNVTNEKYIGSVIVNATASTGYYYEPAPGVNYTVGLSLMVPL